MNLINAVLFDLDGTLLDTIPDLAYALNQLRQEQGLSALPLSSIRPMVSLGSKPMIKWLLGVEEEAPGFLALRERFFELYQNHIADKTELFPHIETVLSYLDGHHIPWGIVTNKLTRHAALLLKKLQLDHRAACLICGDSLPVYKPDPGPIIAACKLLKQQPKNCIYIGDSINDVIASKGAGTKTLVALYGYIGNEDNPSEWQADGYVQNPLEIIDWLQELGPQS